MRNKKITADISQEAKVLLQHYASEHERSFGWLLDRMIKKYCQKEEVTEKKLPKSKISYPSNFNEQFEILWSTKGKKGSKKVAKDKYKKLLTNSDDDTCEALTGHLISDIESRSDELGMTEMHLTTYLNQERWEK